MKTPFEMMKDMYDSLMKDYDMIMSWLIKNHPKILAKYAEYLNKLEEEE